MRAKDTWSVRADEPIFVCYVKEGDREAFLHLLPGRVVEPWHFVTLADTTSVLLILPPDFNPSTE